MAGVRCEHLTKAFAAGARAVDAAGTRALNDVSLDIGDGELVVLVGPSGCGKSTLLRIIAGLESPDSGSVSIGGRDVTAMSPPERNVAMVFQDYALYPHMTVRKNLEFPLRVRGDSAVSRDEKIARIAGVLGLDGLLERLPKELSGGQRQRVAMGRALVREPAVSLLDEPLSNLDAKLRSEVRAEIAELQRRTQTTMVYVTHDQVEAMTLGQRVAVLDRGVLQQAAPPDELYDDPVNTFVAGFLGNPPMNLIPIKGMRDGVAIVGSNVQIEASATGTTAKDTDLSQARTLGVRPEALGLVDPNVGAAIAASVDHVELLGHETLVHASIAGDESGIRVTARVNGTHRFEAGEAIALRPDPSRIYFFDGNSKRL